MNLVEKLRTIWPGDWDLQPTTVAGRHCVIEIQQLKKDAATEIESLREQLKDITAAQIYLRERDSLREQLAACQKERDEAKAECKAIWHSYKDCMSVLNDNFDAWTDVANDESSDDWLMMFAQQRLAALAKFGSSGTAQAD